LIFKLITCKSFIIFFSAWSLSDCSMVALRNTAAHSLAVTCRSSTSHGTVDYQTSLLTTMSSPDNSVGHRQNGRRQHQPSAKSPKIVHTPGVSLSQQHDLLNRVHGYTAVSVPSNGSTTNGSTCDGNTFLVNGCMSPLRRNGFHPVSETSEKHDLNDCVHSSSIRNGFTSSPRKYASLMQSGIITNGHVWEEGARSESTVQSGESVVSSDYRSIIETFVLDNDGDHCEEKFIDPFAGIVAGGISDIKNALNGHLTKLDFDNETDRANHDAVSVMMQSVFKRPKLLLGSSSRKDQMSCRWSKCGVDVEASGMLEHVRVIHVERQVKPGVDVEQSYVCLWDGCKVYNRPSTLRSWLERHVVSHLGVRPYPCIVAGCGQRFSSQQALTRHVNAHFGADVSGFSTRRGDVGKQSAARRRKLRECRPCTGE